MITVDGRKFENVSREFDPTDYCILVTYEVDGEPSAPLYVRRSVSVTDIINFLAEEAGTVQNIKLWNYMTTL
jgi:hypothetical protein